MYLAYEEYKNFGGELEKTEFDRFSFRAECEINNATSSRCKNLLEIPDEVKRCVYELTEYFSKNAKSGSVSAVASFGNDGYSMSYVDQKNAQEQITDIIYTYLADTDLLYCGVD